MNGNMFHLFALVICPVALSVVLGLSVLLEG